MGTGMKLEPIHALPFWPRLLSEDMAAAYLGISKSNFHERWSAAKELPQPHRIGSRVLWDRLLLDRYVDALSGLSASGNSWDDL